MSYVWMSADYTVEGRGENRFPMVYIFGRDENGGRVKCKIPWSPYFYAPEREVFDEGDTFRAVDGTMVKRVNVSLPRDVPTESKRYSRAYEDKLPFPLRVLIDKEIRNGFDIIDGRLVPAEDLGHINMKKMYLDIEVELVQDENGKWPFPEPEIAPNMILTITCATSDMRITDDAFIVDEDELMVFSCTNEEEEKQMLQEFIWWFAAQDVDVLTGWNLIGFDMTYLYNRMLKHGISPNGMSPMNYVESHGKQKFKILGMNVIDLDSCFKKFFQGRTFDSYKLDDIAALDEFVGWEETKFDYERYMNRENLEKIVPYNMGDVKKMLLIDRKLGLIDTFDGMRRVCGCRLEDTMFTSMYGDIATLREFHGHYVLGTRGKSERVQMEGAYVHQPKKGVHDKVIMVDFAGMYPNIIMSYNISPETLVRSPADPEAYHNIPDVRDAHFRKDIPGIVPKMIKKLMAFRGEIKAKMKQYDFDDSEYQVLDKRQYGIKQMIAAIFGYFGFPGSRLYYPVIAGSILSLGRSNIKAVIGWMEERGYEVIYGDSVSGDSPVIVRSDKRVHIVPIEDVAEFNGCIRSTDINYDEIWTKDGWSPIKYVKRHKVDKQMYRVWYYGGVVDVTEDHSLFQNGKPITPKELNEGDVIDLYRFPKVKGREDVSEDLAWCWGVYLAEGSWLGKGQFVVNGDEDMLYDWARRWKRVTGEDVPVRDYAEKNGCWRITWIKERNLIKECYSGRSKIVPMRVLNGNKKVKLAFLRGFFRGDGAVDQGPYAYEFVRIDQKSKLISMGLTYLMNELGQETKVRIHKGKYIGMRFSKPGGFNKKHHKFVNPGTIRKIKKIENCDYVYDVSANGTFISGIVPVVLHNTDSLLIKLDGEATFESMKEEGEKIEADINDFLIMKGMKEGQAHPAVIEYEVGYKNILFSGKKKRYAGTILYYKGKPADTLVIKGFEAKRSDSALISREAQKTTLDLILRGGSKKDVRKHVLSFVERIQGLPYTESGIPKILRKPFEEYEGSSRTGLAPILYSNAYLDRDYGVGDRCMVFYVKRFPDGLPGHVDVFGVMKSVNRVALDEDQFEEWRRYIDWEVQTQKVLENKLEPILDAFGMNFREIITGTEQVSLEAFM